MRKGQGMAKGKAKRSRMELTGPVLRGVDALAATAGAPAPEAKARPAKGTTRARTAKDGSRGPLKDPERARLVPVLYRVTPEDRDALRDEARRRADELREKVYAERERARVAGRTPEPITVREDASEVLREILAAWRKRGGKA